MGRRRHAGRGQRTSVPGLTPAPLPTALVTGATGLVGSYIVERLRDDGWSVSALVRNPSRAEALRYAGVEVRAGDILDAGTFVTAARGTDAVFHAAAVIMPRGGWEEFRRVNVDGTRNAVAAASQAGARLLHVSSVGVYGPATRYAATGARTDEGIELRPLPPGALYARSKRDAEAVALEAHAHGVVWASAVRPAVIYGRRDRQFVPRVGRLLERGFAPVVHGGRSTLAIVHAANVADAAVRAVARDVAGGKAYNVANDFSVSVRDFYSLAAEGLGRRIRLVPVPMPIARAALSIARRIGPLLLGSRMNVVTESSSLDFITRDNPFSSDLARRELEWAPTVRPEIGIPDAFRWWIGQR
jgi:nucleoside-diphosphate-sugar epimerase